MIRWNEIQHYIVFSDLLIFGQMGKFLNNKKIKMNDDIYEKENDYYFCYGCLKICIKKDKTGKKIAFKGRYLVNKFEILKNFHFI